MASGRWAIPMARCNGDRDLTWADLELDLRYQTDTMQSAPKGGGKTTGSGGITALPGG